MSVLRTVFYAKNLPNWERALRIVVALAVVVLALTAWSAPLSWMVAGGAAGFAVTGLVGFCPMCALAGRRLRAKP
jgi:hypothetical protein